MNYPKLQKNMSSVQLEKESPDKNFLFAKCLSDTKTNTESGFSKVENKALREKLYQLIREFPIVYIFYYTAKTSEPSHITIITSDPKQVEKIESRKWIRNRRNESNTLFHVIFHGKMNFEYRTGNPFMACYCRRSAIKYQNPKAKDCPETDWASFKKSFKRYRESYYHDRDILLSEANRFQSRGSLTAMFISYLDIYEYTIRFLEILFIGHAFDTLDLHERIKQLAHFVPRIDGVFVKKSGKEYYLVSELEKAKEVAENGDEVQLNESLFESIVEAELQLHKLVSDRFLELKKQLKSDALIQKSTDDTGSSTEDKELSSIISKVVEIHEVEEIYLFHQSKNHYTTTYFLLIIGKGLGTEILNQIGQPVKAKSEGKLEVVLIGHTRIWIQTNLFYHQAFFKKVMVPENLRYQSNKNHPAIHWENPYTPEYPDLDHYYLSSIKMAAQYFILRDNTEDDNMEGLGELFGRAVLRILRTFIYSKLSYLAHYLPASNFWRLCVYAEPRLEKMEFLFEKCSGENFFTELGNYNRFYHGISMLTTDKLFFMDEILQLLQQKLEAAYFVIKDINSDVS
ncbi:hypothetical protein [uncultured Draconibacterium sp.]|uniref:hypothetical protein n=1 Tax=uncultured Draconibacterium sp. TaxID=1573823 RepID=UPI0025E76C3B|nr:hypothetical protein [uncultured Draconibacterium sp.]